MGKKIGRSLVARRLGASTQLGIDLFGIFVGYALNSGGGWTGDLIIADWHVKRSKSKEVGIVKLQEVFIRSFAQVVP